MKASRRSTSSESKMQITEAVILMAGSGSRLRGTSGDLLKPLIPLLGRPLISYTLDALIAAGIDTITAVIGYAGDRLSAAMKSLAPAGLRLQFVENAEWNKPNGISLLGAANHVQGPFFLTMGDHIFAPELVEFLISRADLEALNLAVDRKITAIFDIEDATKVQVRGNRVTAIGKQLPTYDAIDTGLFVCPLQIFDYIRKIKDTSSCSLADAVQLMAADNKVRAHDIGAGWWHDVDTPEMLSHAEKDLRSRFRRTGAATL